MMDQNEPCLSKDYYQPEQPRRDSQGRAHFTLYAEPGDYFVAGSGADLSALISVGGSVQATLTDSAEPIPDPDRRVVDLRGTVRAVGLSFAELRTRRQRRIRLAPGTRLLRFFRYVVPARTHAVLGEVVADMLKEHNDALAQGDVRLARFVVYRGYGAFVVACLRQIPQFFWTVVKIGAKLI